MTSKLSYAAPTDPLLRRFFIQSLEWLTGKRKIDRIYQRALSKVQQNNGLSLWESALQQMNVRLAYDFSQLSKVPSEGPVVFIANHPYGVIDGLAICHLVSLYRPHFKILLHSALCLEEALRPYILPVDFSESKEAILANIETKRNAMALLREGGSVIIFPAGAISTSKGIFGPAVDVEWKPFVGKMIQMSKATVIPIYFHGQNSRLFQMVSQLYFFGMSQEGRWGTLLINTGLTLRLSLIIRELCRQMGNTLHIEIGDPIPYSALATVGNRGELLEYLRLSVYALGEAKAQET